MKKDRRKWLCAPLYIWVTLFVALPLVYVAGVSLCKRDAVWGVTPEFTLENYRALFNPSYLRVFADSFRTSAVAAVISLLVGYPFAYAMAKSSPARRAALMVLVIVPFWTSALIRTYGWMLFLRANGPVNSLLKSLGLIRRPLKLLYTPGAVYLGYVYTMMPFAILPCFTALESMDWHAVEAARDLGARPARVFFTVTLPVVLPAVAAGMLMAFAMSLDDVIISYFVTGPGAQTLPLKVYSSLKVGVTPEINALCTVTLGVVLLAILIAQRIRGVKSS